MRNPFRFTVMPELVPGVPFTAQQMAGTPPVMMN